MLIKPGRYEGEDLVPQDTPADYDRDAFEEEARRTVESFVRINSLPPLRLEFPRTRGLPVVRGVWADDAFGYYLGVTRVAKVFLDKCHPPSLSGDCWNWPRYKADVTPLGIAAHELGHHVSYSVARRATTPPRRHWAAWTLAVMPELPLTTYGCRSPEEDIAESVKLFVTNPTLLYFLRPVRHCQLRLWWNLHVVETRSWRELLPERHVEMLERRIYGKRAD